MTLRFYEWLFYYYLNQSVTGVKKQVFGCWWILRLKSYAGLIRRVWNGFKKVHVNKKSICLNNFKPYRKVIWTNLVIMAHNFPRESLPEHREYKLSITLGFYKDNDRGFEFRKAIWTELKYCISIYTQNCLW